ncbi:MAG: trypsin-like serine protease, partial [Stackebrandtia sp.]
MFVSNAALSSPPAQADGERKPMPVSSDGSTLEQSELDKLSQPADSNLVPATPPSKKRVDDGARHGEGMEAGGTEGIGTKSIFEPDGRTRSTTSWAPASATVQMTYLNDAGDRVQFCTGFMISPDTVATAGHCVYDLENDEWISGRGFLAFPGRDGVDSAPYGSCAAESFHAVDLLTEEGNREYDYGAVKLDCEVGTSTGTYGYFWQSDSLDDFRAVTRGYPADQEYGTQWSADDRIRETHDRQVFHRADTVGGQSGSPLYDWLDRCSGPCVMAVHAQGCRTDGEPCNDSDTPFTNHNYGPRITEEAYQFLQT